MKRLIKALNAQLGHIRHGDLLERADAAANDPLLLLVNELDERHGVERSKFVRENEAQFRDAWLKTESVEAMLRAVIRLRVPEPKRNEILGVVGMEASLSDEEVLAEAVTVVFSAGSAEHERMVKEIRSKLGNPLAR